MVQVGPLDIGESDVAAAFPQADEVELLGKGSFGTTFRVLADEEEFALKIIHLPGMPDYLWRREVEIMARIDHPNILKLRSSGIVEIQGHQLPFLESEFVEGNNLRAKIAAGDLPSEREQLRGLLTGLLVGVGELHDLGGLHRDIKPENVIARDDDWGRPVILDFGLARLVDMSTHTVYPALLGTLRYMAPEQLRLKPARTRSDLFSIGVTVYEAGTGQHPFAPTGPATPRDLHDLILRSSPRPAKDLNPAAFDERTSQVVARLMSYRAHERLSIADALRDLEEE